MEEKIFRIMVALVAGFALPLPRFVVSSTTIFCLRSSHFVLCCFLDTMDFQTEEYVFILFPPILQGLVLRVKEGPAAAPDATAPLAKIGARSSSSIFTI